MTTTGTLTMLLSFDSTDGSVPAALVQATDGNIYGTTYDGGSANSSCDSGCGTFFQLSAAGVLTTLHSFNLSNADSPAGMIQATDGDFYGATGGGGANGYGTIFKDHVGGYAHYLPYLTTRMAYAQRIGPAYQRNFLRDNQLRGKT